MIRKINRKKHKALEEQYDHYVCEFCMEIGAKEVISEFIYNLQCTLSDYSSWNDMKNAMRKLIKKWEKQLK